MRGSLEREALAAALVIIRRLRRRQRVWLVIEPDGRVVILSLALLVLAASCASSPGFTDPSPATRLRSAVEPALANAANVEVLDWRIEDTGYGSVYAIGELRNNNRTAVGPKLLITAYDGAGRVVDSASCWPASTGNVPAGETWPIECLLTTKPGVERATLRVVDVYQWP